MLMSRKALHTEVRIHSNSCWARMNRVQRLPAGYLLLIPALHKVQG